MCGRTARLTTLDGLRSPAPPFRHPGGGCSSRASSLRQGTSLHAVYYEATTNDSRLALATVTAAARCGAVVANHTGCGVGPGAG